MPPLSTILVIVVVIGLIVSTIALLQSVLHIRGKK